MIAKRVERNSKDNYGRLAEYIAAAKESGEKLDNLWMVNCNAGVSKEDLDLAIIEIEATQNLNHRVKSDKTYHLIISFRDEKPSPEALKDIEEQYAKALGFEEHQRIVATHVNTDNFHMHVAFNKIHPETLLAHTPIRDFYKLQDVSRDMEKKYNLSIDNGTTKNQCPEKPSVKSRDYEATTWEQSFDSYVRETKELKVIHSKAQTWEDIHKGFADYGLVIKPRGNGLVITTKDRKTGIKASSVDRAFSKAAMEKKFGPYQQPIKEAQNRKPKKQYSKKPITTYSKQSAAWNKYIGKKRSKNSLALKIYKNWREFLAAEALNDPLAMAIMNYHKQLISMPGKISKQLSKSNNKSNQSSRGLS